MTHKLGERERGHEHGAADEVDHHHHDHHHHDHHDSDWWARLRHAIGDLTGGHSHDFADQIDEQLEADARGRRALWISLTVLACTALVKEQWWR